MPDAFDFAAFPFDRLRDDERQLLRVDLAAATFAAGQTVAEAGAAPAGLLVLRQGRIEQLDGARLADAYVAGDCVDVRGLLAGAASGRLVATRAVIAHRLPEPAVRALLARNASFAAGLLSDTVQRLESLAERASHDFRADPIAPAGMQPLARAIARAQDLSELARAARAVNGLIESLHDAGLRAERIAAAVNALNGRLFERAWELVAPPALVADSCLFVMGSEGRGEQLWKTDQDNGLVLRDGAAPGVDVAAACERFSAALADFGYPECPGRIMASNPQWRHGVAEFSQTVRRWLAMPDPESLMFLAIFLDARAVSGDATLLEAVRGAIFGLATGSDAMLGRFASAIDTFEHGSGWWNRLPWLGDHGHKERLDLKKAGIFPLVHGVRSLALQQRLRETGTAARVRALVAAGTIGPELGDDLVGSLHCFMALRLEAGLAELRAGLPVSTAIHPARLGSFERGALEHALAVVRHFKAILRHRFRLDML